MLDLNDYVIRTVDNRKYYYVTGYMEIDTKYDVYIKE